MEKPSYLKEVAAFHIDSFNYLVKKGVKLACMDIDPVYTKTDPFVKISICNAELVPLQQPMDTRKHKRTVYPSETRMRHISYYAELRLTLKFETIKEELTTDRTFFVPLMLKSELCLLHGLNEFELQDRKEDKSDPGGYFIVKGKERLIRMFLVPKRNYPLALIQDKWKELKRGCSEYGILIASVKDHHTRSDISLHFVNATKETSHASVEVRVFYRNRSYLIPFILLLKSLVDESDASILRTIQNFKTDDHFLTQCMIGMMKEMLYYNVSNEYEVSEGVYSHNHAKRIIGELFSAVFIGAPGDSFYDVCDHFLKRSVLIHLDNNEEKFKFLCFSICKLFSLVQNQCREDDLDNPLFQEVLSPGQTYIFALKEGAITFLNSVKNSLSKKMKCKGNNFPSISSIKSSTNRAISVSPIVERMLSTGNMPGKYHCFMSTTGYTVPLDRTNVLAVTSQFVGIHKFSMKFYAKNMRKYYPGSWGFLCPAQTPEGENTGLYNYLALKCKVVGLDERKLELDQLYRLGVIPYSDPIAYSPSKKIALFADGKILGWIRTNYLLSFINKITSLRSNGKVPKHTEIVYIPEMEKQMLYQGFYIFSSPGRMVRRIIQANEESLLGSFEQLFSAASYLKGWQYEEANESDFLGMAVAHLPFTENNPTTRSIFACMKIKQAISFPFANLKYRADTKCIVLTYPQSPLISTSVYDDYNWDDNPIGSNVTVAIISYSGFDMEDAIVINSASIERGLMHSLEYRTHLFDFKILAEELDCKVTDLEFKCNPDDSCICHYLDSQGVPHVGNIVRYDSPVLSVFSKKSSKFLIKKYDSRIPAIVDSVRFLAVSAVSADKRLPEETKKVSITYCIKRLPVVGDKFNNRHGQKGVCGALMAPEDLPFTFDGTVPDILINPHGLPTRMSIGMLLEILASKSPNYESHKVPKHVIAPFQFSEKNNPVDYFGDLLKEAGLDAFGEQKFYSGTSGEELEAYVFTGSMYLFRLHHFVEDKYQVQSIAKEVDPRTQQPVNINRDGAIRIGEMERDSLLAHGAMQLIQDRLLHCSDECEAFICKNCQTLLYPVLQPHNPLERNMDLPENKYCNICKMADAFKVKIPYVLVYLMAELSAVGIKMQFTN